MQQIKDVLGQRDVLEQRSEWFQYIIKSQCYLIDESGIRK